MRRGHGSTKVPGVKLRPAPPAERTRSSTKPLQATPTDEIESTESLLSCEKPFKGLTICASGVTDKLTLLQNAIQLGAKSSSALTDKVTHLICEAPGSQKYSYCISHGIPVMKSSWIHDLHAKWLSGELVSAESNIHKYRFPTFQSVRLCVTAIDDIQRRTKIQKLVESNGGTYVDTIGKGIQLTHLVCGPDRGDKADERGFTAKMKFIEKMNNSATEKAHLVWEEWFWDCLEFKGLLSESKYSTSQPRPHRKATRDTSPLLEPISSTADPLRIAASAMPSSDKASSNSTDVEEVMVLKHVPEATARLWEGLLRTRGFSVQAGKLTRDPSMASASITNSEDLHASISLMKSEGNAGSLTRTKSSLNAVFTRTKSMAIKSEPSEVPNAALQHLRSGFTSSVAKEANGSDHPPSTEAEFQLSDKERDLFSGFKFKAVGDANGLTLVEAITLRGGTVVVEPDSHVDFIIVRLATGGDIFRATQSAGERQKFRTECWVEQCIFDERICHVDEHLAFAPLGRSGNVGGAGQLKLHISGLLPHEKTSTVRLIKAIGAGLTDQLSRKNTHLLCPSASGPKFVKAQEWGIPVVDLQWLYDTVKAGEVQNPSSYSVSSLSDQETSTGGGITDITNCDFVQGCSRDRVVQKKPKPAPEVAAASENSYPETVLSATWNTNGLLSDVAEQGTIGGLSPRKMSALTLSSRSATPSKQEPAEVRKSERTPCPDSPTKRNRVPSSTTPSPLKIPVRQESMISSPSTLSSETQANSLKDALSSLLGKRQSLDDSEGGQTTMHSKRSKVPPRSKSKREPFSRTSSTDNISRQTSLTSYPLPILDSKLPSLQDEDEGMKVTYEDPSQQKEKQKLLSIINDEPVEPDPAEKVQEPRKGRNLVRRATRR